MKSKNTKEYRITFSAESIRHIEKMAVIGGYPSKEEVIEDAIGIFRVVVEEGLKGAKVMLKYPDGKLKEIILKKKE